MRRKWRWRMGTPLVLSLLVSGKGSADSSIEVNNPKKYKIESKTVLVDCQPDRMCVNIPTDLDEYEFEECFRRKKQKLCHAINGCGTTFDYLNETHVLYSNQVRYNQREAISWKCLYPVESIANLNLGSPQKRTQIKEIGMFGTAPAGSGRFFVSFQLYSDAEYTSPFGFKPHLPRDGTIRGRVTLHNHDFLSRATVQLTRCWATPFADPTDGFNLINNFCPVQSGAAVKLVNSGTSHYATFEAGVFKFTKSENVFLHCHVRICFKRDEQGKNCAVPVDKCPNNLRQRRGVLESNPDTTISIGPIEVNDAPVISELTADGSFDAREEIQQFLDNENDHRIRIEPAVLWSLLGALMIAAIGLGVILVYWIREDRQKSSSVSEILKDQSARGSVTSVDTA